MIKWLKSLFTSNEKIVKTKETESLIDRLKLMKKAELITYAKDNNIVVKQQWRKLEIIDAILKG